MKTKKLKGCGYNGHEFIQNKKGKPDLLCVNCWNVYTPNDVLTAKIKHEGNKTILRK